MAVIVGGGLAGAAAATLLAQAGHRPLVLERTAGDHDKVCGEFLSTEAQAHLAAIGLDLARLGGAAIGRVRVVWGERQAEAALPFTGIGLTRRRLDAALLDHAAAAGAEVRRGVTVRHVDGGRIATTAGDLTPTILLLASGKHDVRGARRDPRGTLDHLVGFKTYFRVSADARAALGGMIELVLFDGGYAGLQLVEGGVANLCLLVDRARLDAGGGGWDGLFATLLAEPQLARRLGDAEPLLDRPLSIAAVPYGYVHRGPTAAFRLGDQAAVIPSFSGDGMSIALHSARLAARAVLDGADAAAYHDQLRHDVAAQVARATWLQRGGETIVGRRLLVAGLSMLPVALRWAAALTRVPSVALRRSGIQPTGSFG